MLEKTNYDPARSWVNVETGEVVTNVKRMVTDQQEELIKESKENILFYKTIFNQYGEFLFVSAFSQN